MPPPCTPTRPHPQANAPSGFQLGSRLSFAAVVVVGVCDSRSPERCKLTRRTGAFVRRRSAGVLVCATAPSPGVSDFYCYFAGPVRQLVLLVGLRCVRLLLLARCVRSAPLLRRRWPPCAPRAAAISSSQDRATWPPMAACRRPPPTAHRPRPPCTPAPATSATFARGSVLVGHPGQSRVPISAGDPACPAELFETVAPQHRT